MRALILACCIALAAAILAASPAHAARVRRQCEWSSGDNDPVRTCLAVKWRQLPGPGLMILRSYICSSWPGSSRSSTGYEGMHEIDMRRKSVYAGRHKHRHTDKNTNGHCWFDEHNTRIGSGFARVVVDYTVQYNWWPDHSDRLSFTVS